MSLRTRPLRKIAWLEPARLPFGWDDQNIYKGVLFPRAGPRMAGLLDARGYDTTVISEEISPLDVDEIAREFDAVCLSLLSNTAPCGLILGKQLGDRGVPVVAGGYHFAHTTMTPDTLATTIQALDFVPYVIRGEGYTALPQLLDAWQGRHDLAHIPGLSYRVGDEIVHNPAGPLATKEFFNELPLPAWEKVRDRDRMLVVSVHGMQGCPRRCSWCAVWTRDGQRNRNTDAVRVVDELEHALASGHYRHVFMSADNFPAIHTWARDVCEEILRRGIRIPWTCQAEVQAAFRTDLVDLMKRAGCVRWCIGLESITNGSLQASDKRQNVEQMEEAIHILHDRGIHIHGMFICGLPQDTRKSLRETVRWARRMQIESLQFLCLSDLPGSKDYEEQHLWTQSFRPFDPPYDLLNWMFVNGHYARLANDQMSLHDVQRAAIEGMCQFYTLGSVARLWTWPDGDTFRAERAAGQSWWGALRAGVWHNWVAGFLHWRGYHLTRQWDRAPFNRLYHQVLQHPERRAELMGQMLDLLPVEWRGVLEQVAAEQQKLPLRKAA
jgi:radical SAM superfamily enzyme YgiQ (UPF0313 family)